MPLPPRVALGAIAIALFSSLPACSDTPEPRAPTTPPCPSTVPFDDGPSPSSLADPNLEARVRLALPALTAYLADEQKRLGIPALVAGFVDRAGLVAALPLGVRDISSQEPIEATDVFRIASVTKVFTGLSLLALRDACKLDLDDPLTRFVPEAKGLVYPTSDSAPVTLRNLVTHTSGLSRDGPLGSLVVARHEPTEEEMLRGLRGLRLETPGGIADAYSNYGAVLAGLAVSRASGVPYRSFVNETLLSPLGMTSTGWEPPADPSRRAIAYVRDEKGPLSRSPELRLGAAAPGGGLYSNVPDLARFMAFQLAAWPPRSDPETGPVRRSSVRESHGVAGFQSAGPRGLGVNWIIENDCLFGRRLFHNGSLDGYKTVVYLLPEAGFGVVLLASLRVNLEPIALHALHLALVQGAAVDAGLLQGMRALLAQLEQPSPQTFPSTFNPGFYSADPEAFTRFLAGVHRTSGACQSPLPLAARADGSADFYVPCERGDLRVTLSVSPGERSRIDRLSIRPVSACDRAESTLLPSNPD